MRRARMACVVVVERLAVDNVSLEHRNAGAGQHAHLFRFAVGDGRAPSERVEVVVGERLLRHFFLGGGDIDARGHLHTLSDFPLHAIQIAGDELQLGILERGAAAVGQRDPAIEIAGFVVARDGEHVVGVPGKLRRQIRRFNSLLCAAGVLQRPDQGRTAEQVSRQLGESNVVGMEPGDDLVSNLPDRPVVVAQEVRADFFLDAAAVLLHGADQRDIAADVFPQQLLGLEEIVLVVLLEHAHGPWIGEGSKMNRRRIHRRRDVHEAQIEASGAQRDVSRVANEGQIGVVDGQRQVRLIVDGRLVVMCGCRCGHRDGMRSGKAV